MDDYSPVLRISTEYCRPRSEVDYVRSLWIAVIASALLDCKKRPRSVEARDARKWLFSDDDGICTFRWICDHTNIDPTMIRRSLSLEETPAPTLGDRVRAMRHLGT